MMAMRAIEISEFGTPDVLRLCTRDMPLYGPMDLLVKVKAAGVNRPDCLQRQGHYPPPKGASDILGLEVAGTVEAVGADVTHFKPGDQVCALVPGGGYAEYCTVHCQNALPVPQGLSMIEAAAIPETYFTVWHNVFERGALKAKETLLVHGGTSGIGTTAIMLAKHFGATVIATAGTDDKCDFAHNLGADHVINYQNEDFVQKALEFTDGLGVELILDMVGGDYTNRNLKLSKTEGRIVQIAFQKGRKVEIDLAHIMMKRLTFTGSTLRARSAQFKASIADALHTHIWPQLAKGSLKPLIDKTFELQEAAAAHQYMEDGQHKGKIVLVLA